MNSATAVEALEQDAASPLARRKRVVPWDATQLEMEEMKWSLKEGMSPASVRKVRKISGKRFTKRDGRKKSNAQVENRFAPSLPWQRRLYSGALMGQVIF